MLRKTSGRKTREPGICSPGIANDGIIVRVNVGRIVTLHLPDFCESLLPVLWMLLFVVIPIIVDL